jgi:hypothetical protein
MGCRSLAGVSLNRSEQMIFDYLQGNPDERHFWQDKVRSTAKSEPDEHEAARLLEADLWGYYVERSGVVSPFRDEAGREGLPRTSMRNLAELLLRLWTEPRPKPQRQTPAG